MRHLTKQDYAVSRWSGGSTTQLAIFPPGAVYDRRDFLWRLSSATVELERSDFTPLPDYQRYITVLEGAMVLTHGGGSPISLAPGQVHTFDGGSATRSEGRCTDYNLMVRKGRCTGSLAVLPLPGGGRRSAAPAPGGTLAVFCRSGSVTLTAGAETVALVPGECVLAEEAVTLAAEQPAQLLLAVMQTGEG